MSPPKIKTTPGGGWSALVIQENHREDCFHKNVFTLSYCGCTITFYALLPCSIRICGCLHNFYADTPECGGWYWFGPMACGFCAICDVRDNEGECYVRN